MERCQGCGVGGRVRRDSRHLLRGYHGLDLGAMLGVMASGQIGMYLAVRTC